MTYDFEITDADIGRNLGVPDGYLVSLGMLTAPVYEVPTWDEGRMHWRTGYLELCGSRANRSLISWSPGQNGAAIGSPADRRRRQDHPRDAGARRIARLRGRPHGAVRSSRRSIHHHVERHPLCSRASTGHRHSRMVDASGADHGGGQRRSAEAAWDCAQGGSDFRGGAARHRGRLKMPQHRMRMTTAEAERLFYVAIVKHAAALAGRGGR